MPPLQEGAAIAQKIRCKLDLLEGFVIHEHQHSIGFIEELLVLRLKMDLIELIFRAQAFVELAPVAQVLQSRPERRAPLLPGFTWLTFVATQRPPPWSSTKPGLISSPLILAICQILGTNLNGK